LFVLFFLLDLEFLSHLLGSLLDPLHSELLVAVALFEVTHGEQYWVLRLFVSLLHFFEKFGVQHR